MLFHGLMELSYRFSALEALTSYAGGISHSASIGDSLRMRARAPLVLPTGASS